MTTTQRPILTRAQAAALWRLICRRRAGLKTTP
jgi:hypothetical protein